MVSFGMTNFTIKCPQCAHVFRPDGTGYSDILEQIRKQVATEEIKNAKSGWLNDSKKDFELEKEKLRNELSNQIMQLQNANKELKLQQELAISKAVSTMEQKCSTLQNEIVKKSTEKELAEKNFNDKIKELEKVKDEQIAFYKDHKARLSTKMVGENLEKHCLIEFEQKIRPLVSNKNVTFGKDNDAKDGTKGDYIYRETDTNGTELVSIMFDMKDEEDETATKKTNDSHLDKLHKDREKKGCEYAVLVSKLEPDNELYNGGIVNKSHRYPKMYVVRPQFFVPIITLLRDAAQNSLKYKSELALVKNQNLDVTNFESSLFDFQNKFGQNLKDFRNRYEEAIAQIDNAIANLEKTKEALRLSSNHLRLANDKAQELSIKKLTKGNKTLSAAFAALQSPSEVHEGG